MQRFAVDYDRGKAFGELPVRGMSIENGIATIPVHGAMVAGISPEEAWFFDLTDTYAVENDVSHAMTHPDVFGIVLDINSPGGSVEGIESLAGAITEARARKPVYGIVTGGMMASAAYWTGSQADRVYAVNGSELGSVGVYMAVNDYSRMFEAAGISVEVIKSGEHKGAGVPGTSLSDAQREALQESIDRTAATFRSAVMANRPVKEGDLDGRSFDAVLAQAKGFADRTFHTREALFNHIRNEI